MSSANNNLKCVEINDKININNNNNLNDEKINELNAEKAANDCNFWELITDVAKDLDLALQDLSPDFEISNNISENGIICENAGNIAVGVEDSKNTFLFESTDIRTAGNNSQQNAVQHKSDSESIDDNNTVAEPSVDKTSSLLQTNSSTLLPTFTAHSSAISSNCAQKPSYSLQLISLMDNFEVTSDSDNTKQNTIPLFNCNENQNTVEDMGTESQNASDDCLIEEKKEENSGADSESIPADIGLLERLIRCHPIWFLPEIGRAGVVHLLQGKEPGCFIVRQSSKANTMALSVRLPEGRGPHIEHYLIEDGGDGGRLHLEGSDNYFSAIPMLVCHYSNCCDELPVQLILHKVLAQSNRQQLTSLALLGQDFWHSSLSKITNSGDAKSDENPNYSPNSSTIRTNLCSTFKSETQSVPPPIPPKQEVTAVDPLIDTKKSSTVPISQVIAPKQGPKLPPKPPKPDPPPVPPRSKFVALNGGLTTNQTSAVNNNNINKPLINTNASNSIGVISQSPTERTAPNTEITLIQLNDKKNKINSSTSPAPNSSQASNNSPKDNKKSPTNAQKQVLCYRSSLHDKESDYEDIWGANTIAKLKNALGGGGVTETGLSHNKKLSQSTQTDPMKINSGSVSQTSSCFYIDPIDAIPNRRVVSKSSNIRRSDSDINEAKPSNPSIFGHSMESLIDSIRCESSQIDTCLQTFCTFNPNLADVQLQVGCSTFARHKSKEVRETSWPLDRSWKWLDENLSSLCDRPFRRESIQSCRRSSLVESMKSDITTVEDMLTIEAPELTVPKVAHLINKESTTVPKYSQQIKADLNERYDNLAIYRNKPQNSVNKTEPKEVVTDTDTEFSEPWDSDWWEGLIKKVFPKNSLIQFSPETEENNFLLNRDQSLNNCENCSTLTSLSDSRITSTFDITEVSSIGEIRSICSATEDRDSTASDRLTVLEANDSEIGLNISHYIFELWSDGNNTFAKAVNHFIQCTEESNETNPLIVMRNIRQFMNGMKNYLVKHGEGQLDQMIQRERAKLKQNEFLNIDAILESALHRLVIKPLKKFLYQLFIKEYTKNGSLKVLSQNIRTAQSKTSQELGVRPELIAIDSKTMIEIQKHLTRLQKSYSPLKKLEYLLSTISTIYNSVRQNKKSTSSEPNGQSKPEYASFGADDFLPVFIYVLIQCGVVSAEIESEYMFGLLQPSILCGEGGYYLTTLSSAIHVLKHMHQMSDNSTDVIIESNEINSSKTIPHQEMNSSSSETSVTSASGGQHSPYTQIKLPTIADLKAYMKIMIPDEFTSSIAVKTLPVRPNMSTKEVCKMIAHKFKVTNAEDFGLFKVINGEEIQLNDNDLPQIIKSDAMAKEVDVLFAYKRFDAKFIWPINRH